MADSAESPVLRRVRALLDERGVWYELSSHRPVYTSADAAAVRGVSLHSGAKALVVKLDKVFGRLAEPEG